MSHAILYKNASYNGTAVGLMVPDQIIGIMPMPSMYIYGIGSYAGYFSHGFNDQLSSAQLFPGYYPLSAAVLSQNTLVLFETWNFQGKFNATYFDHSRGVPFYQNFNDITSSAVIIQHPNPNNATRIGVSIKQAAGSSISSIVSNALSGITSSYPFQRVLLWGTINYQFTIDYQGYLGIPLVRVDIPIRIVLEDPFRDSNGDILFYLQFSLVPNPNGSGTILAASIVGYDITNLDFLANTEKSTFLSKIKAQIPSITEKLNDGLLEENKDISFLNLKGTYLIPWSSAFSQPNALYIQNFQQDFYGSTTNDDCLLVLYN
jgi:hypothetical protein